MSPNAIALKRPAYDGHSGDAEAANRAFRAGASLVEADTGSRLEPKTPEECGLREIEVALDNFALATPLVKKRLLHASGKTVMSDQRVTSDEAELIRAIADAIGCPIPPFVKTGAAALT